MIPKSDSCLRWAAPLVALLSLLAAPAGASVELDRIIAVVNDDVIAATDLIRRERLVERQLRQQSIELPPPEVLRRQLLERMIVERLQMQLAERTGIRIDDGTLNAALARIARTNGLTLEQFRDALEREGFDFEDFREQIRNEIAIGRLQQREVANRVTISDQELEQFLATQEVQGEQAAEYRLAHILISVPEGATPEQIAAAERKAKEVYAKLQAGADFAQTAIAVSDGQQALQGGDLGWRRAEQIPSLFVDTVRALKPGEISAPIRSPSGFHIVQLVDARGAEQSQVITQTHVRHILIRPDAITTDQVAELRLEQLRDRILGGDDFATLARAHSDDSVSAIAGGELGWVNPGELDPHFEQVMNELAPGEVSEPFQTRFGWHIVQVLERRQHDSTEDYKRAQAREQLRQRRIAEALELWLRRLRDEAYVEYRLASTE